MIKIMMMSPLGASALACLMTAAPALSQSLTPDKPGQVTITRPALPGMKPTGVQLPVEGKLAALPQAEGQSQAKNLTGQITATEQLPNPFTHAVELEGRDGIAFISQNGRFVLRGMVFDMWTGQTLASLDDIRKSKTSVNLNELGLKDEDVDPFRLGTGEKKVTLFVDPLCPFCAQLFDQIAADPTLEDEFTFIIYTVPFLGDNSAKAVTALSCSKDRQRALEALLAKDRRWMATVDTADCNLEPIMKRTIMSQMLGVTGVPFLVGPQGGINRGLPKDLRAFLSNS